VLLSLLLMVSAACGGVAPWWRGQHQLLFSGHQVLQVALSMLILKMLLWLGGMQQGQEDVHMCKHEHGLRLCMVLVPAPDLLGVMVSHTLFAWLGQQLLLSL
jgi:hypothetical protein